MTKMTPTLSLWLLWVMKSQSHPLGRHLANQNREPASATGNVRPAENGNTLQTWLRLHALMSIAESASLSFFEMAMVDESYFPPRCCRTAIPLERNQLFLSEELIREYRAKSVEFSTQNRTYCHRPSRSAFVPPTQYILGVATCLDCGAKTCTICKCCYLQGDCPHDISSTKMILLVPTSCVGGLY
ncbi:hypothetical protein F4778DRAFT_444886 [Xylariomycetidae sp. FL2044]|nr:hypothetical protein F4778DRAFT_444886 [Xylariomycetidae sp. FL2044]